MRALSSLLLVLALPLAASAQDFSGVWDVAGQDPLAGAYTGWVDVVRAPTGNYEVRRLIEAQKKLPDGRTLVLSWRGTARNEAGGLRVDYAVKRQDFISEIPGVLVRGPADKQPYTFTARFADPSGQPVANVAAGQKLAAKLQAGTFAGPDESWVRVLRVPVPHPWTEITRDPFVSNPILKSLLFAMMKDYHRLPAIAPYAGRADFQAAVHFQVIDTTAKEYTRAHPDHVVVVQKLADEISILEETLRANALRWKLHEKASRCDHDQEGDHVEGATGMIGGYILASKQRLVHGDSCLHQGSWVSSQAWRWLATQDPQAMKNVELGTKALILMCDAPGNPTEFGRAVMQGPPPPGWQASTALPGISYIPGGNNDMMHGMVLGFTMAEKVLPAGHALLKDIGRCAKSLAENHKEGKKGKHEICLTGIAARLTGDAAMAARYKKRLTWNLIEKLWLATGDGASLLQEVGGRSGPHLQTTTIIKIRNLGGTAAQSALERSWCSTANLGMRTAYNSMKTYRPGFIAVVADSAGYNGAGRQGRDVLGEIPYPRHTGTAKIEWAIDPDYCMSPYAAMPWKFDFLTDPGRHQSLVTQPLWTIGDTDNFWKEGPNDSVRFPLSTVRWSHQDFLHAYWYGRAHGSIYATD